MFDMREVTTPTGRPCDGLLTPEIPMSDSAFKTAAYPGLTTEQLKAAYIKNAAIIGNGAIAEKMQAELDRRFAVSLGDISAMTAGERLRHYKAEAGL